MQKLPQLTLRDLFWLVLVAAILISWGLDHHRSETRINELTKVPFAKQRQIHITPIETGFRNFSIDELNEFVRNTNKRP